jgi:hypothetical protein
MGIDSRARTIRRACGITASPKSGRLYEPAESRCNKLDELPCTKEFILASYFTRLILTQFTEFVKLIL